MIIKVKDIHMIYRDLFLLPNSVEEEVARDFVCFAKPDCCVVVTDATCLERS